MIKMAKKKARDCKRRGLLLPRNRQADMAEGRYPKTCGAVAVQPTGQDLLSKYKKHRLMLPLAAKGSVT